ncbi:hypothetical protein VTK26DRAFT_7536 [Humicola hyalothermophila]
MSERMTWDHRADHDLLTAIMQELQPTQEQLRGVMNRMHSFGYSCTVKAITQHLQKLRRKEGSGPAAANDSGPGTPKTPAKKRATPKKDTPASGSKRKPAVIEDDSEDEAKPPVKREKKVKQEVKEERSPATGGFDPDVQEYGYAG